MHSPFRRAVLRALVLLDLATMVASCGAAPSNQDSVQVTTRRSAPRSVRSTPVPTAASTNTPTESISPSPTPTPNLGSAPFITGSIELRAPKEPVQLEAQVKPTEVKPFEIKPVEVRLPKDDLHLAVGGIPQPIKVEWDIKTVPLNVRWPSEPIKVTIIREDQEGGSTRSVPCGEGKGNEALSYKGKSRPLSVNDWQKKIDDLEKQIREEAEVRRKSLEEEHKSGQLTQQQFDEKVDRLNKDVANRVNQIPEVAIAQENSNQRLLWIFLTVVAILGFGILGGFAIHTLEFFRNNRELLSDLNRERIDERRDARELLRQGLDRREQKGELEKLRARHEERQKELRETLHWNWVAHRSLYQLLPRLFLGVVAALLVPGALLFIPVIRLQSVSEDPLRFVSLCSFCFLTAMIGEPFIEFVLQKLRNQIQNNRY